MCVCVCVPMRMASLCVWIKACECTYTCSSNSLDWVHWNAVDRIEALSNLCQVFAFGEGSKCECDNSCELLSPREGRR